MRRPWAARTGIVAIASALAACTSGGGSSSAAVSPSSTVAPATTRPATTIATVATTPIPGPSSTTTVAATTTAVATTAAVTTIATSTTAAATTTTTGPAPSCDATALLAAANETFGLPAGATVSDPRCVGGWASAVVTASGQDNAFAVFDVMQGRWQGANLGTDQVCSAAGVPQELYGPLGCGPWEG